jgi:hypothetical protein
MKNRAIWLTASKMVTKFGDDAAVIAATCAETMLQQGDDQCVAICQRVLLAIGELTATEQRGAVN